MMKIFHQTLFFLIFTIIPIICSAALSIGVGKTDLTPPIGTPSAGYTSRRGEGMQGVHDPLQAIALFIDNGEKKIVLCSVDHLGFTYDMVQAIIEEVHWTPELSKCEIYIASSHTHSGGGAYLDIPRLGESLAGAYSAQITKFYIQQTVEAILQAHGKQMPAKLGVGYGKVEGLSQYRGSWPIDVSPLPDITVIKVTDLNDKPLAALFNYAVHPTVLRSQNRLFSADFVGYARDYLQSRLGVQPLYFNGAQGDIIPMIFNKEDFFAAAAHLGHLLAEAVEKIWNEIDAKDAMHIKTEKESYAFKPQATPFGLVLPIEIYKTEMNLIVFNHMHAFITIPGELSCIYDKRLKEIGAKFGYAHTSIFGLTNDAHGYIILPESWMYKTFESGLSFGGVHYGELVENRAKALLMKQAHSIHAR